VSRDPDETCRLIKAIEAFLCRFVVFSAPLDPLRVALFVLHTYAVEYAEVTPYLSVSSAEKMSGKSTLLDLLETVVCRPWLVVSVSEAVAFRKIQADSPTLLLDEVDTIFKGPPEYNEGLRAILNAGFERGRTVPRCVGPKHDVVEFSVFGPKVLVGLGSLPDTVSSRCIHVRLERKLPGDQVERRNRRVVRADAGDLRDWLESWAGRDAAALEGLEPVLPEGLGDREADIWEPLLAIAELAGPATCERAVAAALDRTGLVDQSESTGVKLLASIRDAFGSEDRLAADDLLRRLNNADNGFGAWHHGAGMTRPELAKYLGAFGIANVVIYTPGGPRTRGFYLRQFADAFARYLPRATTEATAETA
jgi:hypothetical protein